MDIDILKKLVKLANHNPNENESNSAARKVCKMLEDDGFKALGGSIAAPVTPPFSRPRSAPSDMDFEELVRRAQERERQRQKDREERERTAKESPVTFHFQCSSCGVDITTRMPVPAIRLCLKCKYKKATGKEWGT